MKKIKGTLLMFTILLSAVSCTDKKSLIAKSVNEFAKFELGTVEYTVTKAVAGEKGVTHKDVDLSLGDKKILYSLTATLKAGVDLGQFDPETDITVKGSEVTLSLPKTKLLVLNIAPSSIKYEFSKVSWYRSNFTETDRNEILRLGEQSIRDAVPGLGILTDAEKEGAKRLKSMFMGFGFKDVVVNIVNKAN